jgi:hypothetical protein
MKCIEVLRAINSSGWTPSAFVLVWRHRKGPSSSQTSAKIIHNDDDGMAHKQLRLRSHHLTLFTTIMSFIPQSRRSAVIVPGRIRRETNLGQSLKRSMSKTSPTEKHRPHRTPCPSVLDLKPHGIFWSDFGPTQSISSRSVDPTGPNQKDV